MKNFLVLCLVILLTFLFGNYFRNYGLIKIKKQELSEQIINKSNSISAQSSESLNSISKLKKLPFLNMPETSQTNKNPYSQKISNNKIEFQVVEDLAIAYGDLILGKLEEGSAIKKGHYEISPPVLWDNPDIPYLIHPDLPNPTRIEKALEYFKQHTSVRFVPYEGLPNQPDAILFEAGKENCYSTLGKMGGIQPIKLSANCQTSDVIHEIMHALGFVHEQSRPDRDQYVEILWQNIKPDYQSQFAMVPDILVENEIGSQFDYQSIMLYPPNSFAVSPELMTLKSIKGEQIEPVNQGLSDSDIKRVNQLFESFSRK